MIECVPTVKNDPEAGLFEIEPQLPVLVAAPNDTNAPGSPPCVVLAVTTIFAGQSSVQSSTVTPSTLAVPVEELFALLGSVRPSVVLKTVAVFEITVPEGVPESTSKLAVKIAVSPLARVAAVHTTSLPTTAQLNPDGPETRANCGFVVFAGRRSVTCTLVASLGP
jgi:hypothetical protein